jgi:hypothetical protein
VIADTQIKKKRIIHLFLADTQNAGGEEER